MKSHGISALFVALLVILVPSIRGNFQYVAPTATSSLGVQQACAKALSSTVACDEDILLKNSGADATAREAFCKSGCLASINTFSNAVRSSCNNEAKLQNTSLSPVHVSNYLTRNYESTCSTSKGKYSQLEVYNLLKTFNGKEGPITSFPTSIVCNEFTSLLGNIAVKYPLPLSGNPSTSAEMDKAAVSKLSQMCSGKKSAATERVKNLGAFLVTLLAGAVGFTLLS